MKNRFTESVAALEANEAQIAVPASSSGQPAIPLLSDIVTKMPRKSRGVAHNIYLSKPVSQALEREAKRRDMTKGKLVDEVLKRVFGVE
jgi:hypothetical protein